MVNRNRRGVFQRIASAARAFAEPKGIPLKTMLSEIGIPGGQLDDDGLTVEDYNPSLYGRAWFEKVDEMLVASSQAAVVELCWCLPVVSTTWEVVGGSDELRNLCSDALFSPAGMSTTWPEVCYQAALSACYGTSFFELVWKEVDGALTLRRLVDRDQVSIDRYEWDKDGGLASVVQVGPDPDHPDEEIEVTLPIEKCLLLPYRGRRRELHGRSVLRPAYSHYYTLDMITRFANIGLDHSLVGVPVGRAPANAKPADQAKFLSILRALRRHEASGMVLPPGWDLVDGRSISGGGDSVGFLDYIQWHEGALLRAGLSGYMQLGSTSTGTKEVSSDLIRVQMMGLQVLADGIASRFTRHVLRRLCDANVQGLTEEDYPELICRPIQDLFTGAAPRFVDALAEGQVEIPAGREEQAALVRDGLGLPDGDDRAEGAAASAPPSAGGSRARPTPESEPRAGSRQAAEASRRRFAAPAVDGWPVAMEAQLNGVLARLVAQAESAAGDPERIAAIAVSAAEIDRWADLVTEWLIAARLGAVEALHAETGRIVAGSESRWPQPAEIARGRVIAQHLADEARLEIQMAALAEESAQEMAARYATKASATLSGDLQSAARDVATRASEEL